jgi:soluble lytic murein transglycosylase
MSFYSAAAPHATTYYGQLAAARIGKVDGYLPQEFKPGEQEILAFNKGELVRVVRLLGELGDRDHLRTFVLHLSANARTPGQSALVAALALEQERPDLAVLVAKRSRRNGFALIPYGYPMVSLPDGGGPEPALLLAVIRQESAFDPEAVSHAGARGLMQLMPSTAKTTAKELKVKYSRSNLTTDPDYNIKLGSAHLAHLLDQFNGSYVLALGAYNAGSPRVRQWLAAHGDPRSAEVDVINWIEMIPLAETRNFVQRVLENLRIYRQRLGGTQITQSIESDLERGRHSGAAETTSRPCDTEDEGAVRSSLTAC